jgi:hypothetical protein
VPRTTLTNHDLERRLDTSDEWVRTRTGISQRNVLTDGELLPDIAAEAARTALARASLKPSDLDAIVVGTVSSDYAFPSLGCQLQHRLGVQEIPSFDVAAACSGFIYALTIADNALRAGQWRRVLVIGADALSTMVDWNDRRTAVLFGDGAGAAAAGHSGVDRDTNAEYVLVKGVFLNVGLPFADLAHPSGVVFSAFLHPLQYQHRVDTRRHPPKHHARGQLSYQRAMVVGDFAALRERLHSTGLTGEDKVRIHTTVGEYQVVDHRFGRGLPGVTLTADRRAAAGADETVEQPQHPVLR